jgi:MFS family permease
MKVAQLRFPFVVGVTTVLAAVGYAATYVALHDWFGRGDLIALMTWSLPLAFGVAVLITALSARISRASAALTFVLCAVSGAMLGVLWTSLVALVLGGWIATFSFPVLWCWVAGGFLGGLAAAWMSHPRSRAVPGVLILVASIALVRINTYASQPERAIRVVIKADANAEEVDSVWMDVLGRRTGRGAEHALLPGLSSVGGAPKEGRSPVLIAEFWSGTSPHMRDSVIAQILRSPLILRVDTLPTR